MLITSKKRFKIEWFQLNWCEMVRQWVLQKMNRQNRYSTFITSAAIAAKAQQQLETIIFKQFLFSSHFISFHVRSCLSLLQLGSWYFLLCMDLNTHFGLEFNAVQNIFVTQSRYTRYQNENYNNNNDVNKLVATWICLDQMTSYQLRKCIPMPTKCI